MSNALYVSIVLIALAAIIRCEYNFSSEDSKITEITPDSISSVCSQVNTYTSYQECTCNQFCLENKNSECCSDQQYCKERQYKYEELSCEKTLSGDVYMVNTCLPNYPRSSIISKCQTTNLTEILNDFFITLPITSPQNITYRNIYCGLCNNVPAYVIWNLAVRCENINSNASKADNINSTSLFYNLDINPDGTYLSSTVNGSMFKCVTYGYPPYGWTDSVKYCGSNNETRKCSLCEKSSSDNRCVDTSWSDSALLFSSSLKNGYLLRDINEFMYGFIYEDKSAFSKVFYNIATDKEKCSPKGNIPICKYQSKPRGDFYYVDKETIFVKGDINAPYSHKNWNRTLNGSEIYFCLDETTSSEMESNFLSSLRDVVVSVLQIFSVIFLIAYFFVMYSQKEAKLQSLTSRIILSFSITLLGVYLLVDQAIATFSCSTFLAALSHYVDLSLFVWILIAAYDFWRIICGQYELVGKANYFVRYAVYCSVGWISPLTIIFIGLYFDSAPMDTISCELKPVYGRTYPCFVRDNKAFSYLYSYPSTVIFCISIIFFIHTFYRVHIIKESRENNTSRDELLFTSFFKSAGIMSLEFLKIFWMYSYSRILYSIMSLAIAPLGILIFFAFGFDKNMAEGVLKKFRQ